MRGYGTRSTNRKHSFVTEFTQWRKNSPELNVFEFWEPETCIGDEELANARLSAATPMMKRSRRDSLLVAAMPKRAARKVSANVGATATGRHSSSERRPALINPDVFQCISECLEYNTLPSLQAMRGVCRAAKQGVDSDCVCRNPGGSVDFKFSPHPT